MKKLINRYKLILSFIFIITITSFLFTALEYANINYMVLTCLERILSYIFVFIYSFIKASKSSLKGYKIGLKSAIYIIILYSLINIVTFSKVSLYMIIHYLLIIVISVLSGIIQKNKRKN